MVKDAISLIQFLYRSLYHGRITVKEYRKTTCTAFQLSFKSRRVLGAHWLLWSERHLQPPITTLRRLRWANGVRERERSDIDTSHVSVAQPKHEIGIDKRTTRQVLPRMPWCVVRRQPHKRRGCKQPETKKIYIFCRCNCVLFEFVWMFIEVEMVSKIFFRDGQSTCFISTDTLGLLYFNKIKSSSV